MIIKNAEFVMSVKEADKIPETRIEIAIVGKSNVGKSTFINFLTNQSKLARASKEPGRTRLINFFSINGGEFHFVDLPGYGYATASYAESNTWDKMMRDYFRRSAQLKHAFVLLDIRHEPGDMDKQMINYLTSIQLPMTVICTKADKLSTAQKVKALKIISDSVKMPVGNLFVVSSNARLGMDAILARLDQIIENA